MARFPLNLFRNMGFTKEAENVGLEPREKAVRASMPVVI
jgi:hypothetical protein